MTRLMQQRSSLLFGGAFCALACPGLAMAQGAETTTAPVAAADSKVEAPADTGGIVDIIVTAQRRSERLQNVPVAVTAVSGARLEATGIQDARALSLVTPGLTYAQNSGFAQPHIRGVGSSTNGPGLEQPVATYIDGVYIASATASLMTLNNVERIEVLKGPQGTLFGRNATGGLIQVVTRDPKQTPSGAFNLSYGNYQNVTGDAYLTGGLSETLSADIAFRYEDQGKGYGRNLGTGNEIGKLNHDLASRIKLLWTPSSDTKVRLAVDYESRSSSRDVYRLDDQYPATFNNFLFGGPYPLGGPHDTTGSFDQVFRFKGGGASAQINQTIGAVELMGISAYRESTYSYPSDVDGIPPVITQINPLHVSAKQFSQELQLSPVGAGRLKWVAGLYYFYSHDQYDPGVINFGPTPISPVPDTPVTITINDGVKSNSVAAYAQATYELLPDTNLTLGGRYTYEHKAIDGTVAFAIAGTTVSTTPIITPASGISDKIHFSRFNYRIALDHKITPDVMVYASYNTGFKSGGYNLGAQDNPPYKPETIKALEAGIKSELFDRHLRINLSGFHYSYNNIQIGRFVGGNIFIYNGAKARNSGFDLDAEVAVARGLTLTGGFSYLHARFGNSPGVDFITPVTPPLPVPNLGGIRQDNAQGKHLPFSPTTTVNLGGNYNFDTAIGSFAVNVNYFRSGKFFAAPDNVLYQRAYDLLDLSIGWTAPDDHISLKGFAKNLGDTNYRTQLTEATQGAVVSFGPPRTYGVTVGYKF